MFSRAVRREELQANVTGVCGECRQCFSRTHGTCAFPGYTSQALGCSAGTCQRRALDCAHFPCLSRSGSGSRGFLPQRRKLGWACVLCPSQVRAAQVTRRLASTATPSWGVRLIGSPKPAARFSGCTTGAPSQVCRVSLLRS